MGSQECSASAPMDPERSATALLFVGVTILRLQLRFSKIRLNRFTDLAVSHAPLSFYHPGNGMRCFRLLSSTNELLHSLSNRCRLIFKHEMAGPLNPHPFFLLGAQNPKQLCINTLLTHGPSVPVDTRVGTLIFAASSGGNAGIAPERKKLCNHAALSFICCFLCGLSSVDLFQNRAANTPLPKMLTVRSGSSYCCAHAIAGPIVVAP